MEDLDHNPFFHALKREHKDVYNMAAEERHIICVPHTDSLEGMEMTRDFVGEFCFGLAAVESLD